MTGCPFIAGTPIGRVFRRQMKGRKKQPAFIAEPFKIKRISESRHANKQIIINVLSLIYDRYERFIFFRLCNNNPPGISILKINYITILAAPNKQKYICKNTQDIEDRFHTGFYIVLHIMIKCIIIKAVWYGKSRILRKAT